MNSTDLSWWYGTYYGDSWYKYKEFTDLANAKSDFAGSFSAYMKLKQPYIDSYYNNLFGKINNFLDKIEFTKEGITTLEKHKGRKESTNTNVKDSFEESTKKSEATNIKESKNENYDDKTTHGKTTTENGGRTDKHFRTYFGSNTLVQNAEDRHENKENSTQYNVAESGDTTIAHSSNGNNNYIETIGTANNNYTETLRNKNNNYHEKIANALENYTKIEDISDSIFDKDVMDYNNYKETTTNTWHEGQMAVMLLDRLKDTNFIEKILHEFFCTVSCDIS